MPPWLELRDVVRERPGEDRSFTLDIRAFTLRAGEALAVLGPSGCGKSTLLALVGLALAPSSAGRFALHRDGRETALGPLWREDGGEALAALRACMFGYVLQAGGVLPFLTVRDNVALTQRLAGRPDAGRVAALLDRLGLGGLAGEWPGRLSVGQRQRVGIARALAHRPAFVIADEPTAALDPGNARGVVALLLELAAADGAALLLVSHDLALVTAAGIPVLDMAAPGGDARRWVSVVDRAGAAPPRLGALA